MPKRTRILFAGDINLMDVHEPQRPFALVKDTLADADLRFANLDCSFIETPEGFQRPPDELRAPLGSVKALADAGFDVVGTANNGNYGAEAIISTIETLAGQGISRTGSGRNVEDAYRPAIVERNGVKVGFVQRTSVYWPSGHEVSDLRPGVAVLPGHTSYGLRLHRTGPTTPGLNRPGVPLQAHTWADPEALSRLQGDIEELREKCDIVISSHHWGLKRDVLNYMSQIAHGAIDAGADAVIGHGPHFPHAVEVYNGRPVFYSLSNFCFNIGHASVRSGNWAGMMARVDFEDGAPVEVAFRWVRHDDAEQTWFPDPAAEPALLADVAERSKVYGTTLSTEGDEIRVALNQ